MGDPQARTLPQSTFQLPEQVPLSDWQWQESKAFKLEGNESASQPSGRHYQYFKNGVLLNVETYYLSKASDNNADIKQLLQSLTHLPPDLIQTSTVYYQSGIGFHSFFTHQKTAYLTACMNPEGESTVDQKQFVNNQINRALQPERLTQWIQGRVPLRDDRCIWVMMSTPLEGMDQKTAQTVLAAAWVDWFNWWKSRFPALAQAEQPTD